MDRDSAGELVMEIVYHMLTHTHTHTGPNQDFTVHLSYTVYPYTQSLEFDPNLGRHDDFLLLGPYIFAQRTESGVVQLYVSFNRTAFNRSRIPSNEAHKVSVECLFTFL